MGYHCYLPPYSSALLSLNPYFQRSVGISWGSAAKVWGVRVGVWVGGGSGFVCGGWFGKLVRSLQKA